MRKAPTSIKVSYHKKAHLSKWNPLKHGKVPTSMGATHAKKVYKKKLQKDPTSVVVPYTKMVKRCQCKGKQKHKVKDKVRHYPNHKSPILGKRPRRLRKELDDNNDNNI